MSANSNVQNCCGGDGGRGQASPCHQALRHGVSEPAAAGGPRVAYVFSRQVGQERRGGVPGSERGTGECASVQPNMWTSCVFRVRPPPCLCSVYPCAPVCVCVHERADVYSLPRSNAHSQMKSSNVSGRKPQPRSHGS